MRVVSHAREEDAGSGFFFQAPDRTDAYTVLPFEVVEPGRCREGGVVLEPWDFFRAAGDVVPRPAA